MRKHLYEMTVGPGQKIVVTPWDDENTPFVVHKLNTETGSYYAGIYCENLKEAEKVFSEEALCKVPAIPIEEATEKLKGILAKVNLLCRATLTKLEKEVSEIEIVLESPEISTPEEIRKIKERKSEIENYIKELKGVL